MLVQYDLVGLVPFTVDRASTDVVGVWPELVGGGSGERFVHVPIQGRARSARRRTFAGGWTCVVERPMNGMWLTATGLGVGAEGIGLVALPGVDERGAVGGVLDVTQMNSLRATVVGAEEIRSPGLHPDHRALLDA